MSLIINNKGHRQQECTRLYVGKYFPILSTIKIVIARSREAATKVLFRRM